MNLHILKANLSAQDNEALSKSCIVSKTPSPVLIVISFTAKGDIPFQDIELDSEEIPKEKPVKKKGTK